MFFFPATIRTRPGVIRQWPPLGADQLGVDPNPNTGFHQGDLALEEFLWDFRGHGKDKWKIGNTVTICVTSSD